MFVSYVFTVFNEGQEELIISIGLTKNLGVLIISIKDAIPQNTLVFSIILYQSLQELTRPLS